MKCWVIALLQCTFFQRSICIIMQICKTVNGLTLIKSHLLFRDKKRTFQHASFLVVRIHTKWEFCFEETPHQNRAFARKIAIIKHEKMLRISKSKGPSSKHKYRVSQTNSKNVNKQLNLQNIINKLVIRHLRRFLRGLPALGSLRSQRDFL